MRTCRRVIVSSILACVCATASAQSVTGTRLIWEAQEDFGGGPDLAFAVTVSGTTTAVPGVSGSPDPGNFVVRGVLVLCGGRT
jgi:hypothetical protein